MKVYLLLLLLLHHQGLQVVLLITMTIKTNRQSFARF
jgi:hypothetical protein